MEISDEQIARANDEPIVVGLEVCKMVTRISNASLFVDQGSLHLEAVMFFFCLSDSGLLTYTAPRPEIVEGKVSHQEALVFIESLQMELEAIQKREKSLKLQRELEARLSRGIKGSFGYEFTEGDFKEVQALVNKLRDLISDCADLDDEHKQRLHKRLEQVQRELHKKVSTLDQIYALAIEASIVAGKLGTNAKPLVEVAKSLMGISWRTHAHTEGLPSGIEAPMLNHDSEPPALE